MNIFSDACLISTTMGRVDVSATLLLSLALLFTVWAIFNEIARPQGRYGNNELLASSAPLRSRRTFFFGAALFLVIASFAVVFSGDLRVSPLASSNSVEVKSESRPFPQSSVDVLDGVKLTPAAYVAPTSLAESRAYAPDPDRQEASSQRAVFVAPEKNSLRNEEIAPFPLSVAESKSSELGAVPNVAAVSHAYAPVPSGATKGAESTSVSGQGHVRKSVLGEFTPARALLPTCFASKSGDSRISPVGYSGREAAVNASQIGVSGVVNSSAGTERSFLEILDDEKAIISDEVRSSVVTINVRRRIETGGYDEAHGSGFIVQYGSRIFVLTNEHVVVGATCSEIEITTFEGNTLHPIRVSPCSKFDVAALELDAHAVSLLPGLKLCRLSDSSCLRAGSGVFTIGAPLFMDWTLTYCNVGRLYSSVPELKEAGIIKSDEKSINESQNDPRDLVRYIQISGVILEGNSGGPLFNVKGDVVGMVTATIQRQSITTGIGFAIPIEDVLSVVRNMVDLGGWERSYLGVTIDGTTSSEFVKSKGVRLSEVIANSPADLAGVKVGDCVYTFNGERVWNRYDLARLIALTKPGEEGKMEVIRDGRPKSIVFTTRVSSNETPSKSTTKTMGTTIRR